MAIIISDANPVQFWPANCESFNEKEPGGVFRKCFCAPFNCDDRITTQFTDASPFVSPVMVIKFDDGSTTYLGGGFTSVTQGSLTTYVQSFVPSEHDICDEQIQLLIYSAGFLYYWPVPNLGGWEDILGTWTKGADYVEEEAAINDQYFNGFSGTESVTVPITAFGTNPAGNYHFSALAILQRTGGDPFNFASITLSARNGGTVVSTLKTQTAATQTGNVILTIDINTVYNIPGTWDNILVTFDTNQPSSPGPNFNASYNITFNPVSSVGTAISLAQGDAFNSFDIEVTVTGLVGELSLRVFLHNSTLGEATSEPFELTVTNDVSSQTHTVPIMTADLHGADILKIEVEPLSGDATTVKVVVPSNGYMYVSSNDALAKSDCLSIKEEHDETVLINYHNNRRFASIDSSVGTPDPEFNLRIPACFFHERNPREVEAIILSDNSSLQTMAQIKRQRKLEVQHMPDYMHLKLLLALSFSNVTIDGFEWMLEETYDKPEGNRRFPLKSATTWLTMKNYVLRNVL